MGNKISLRTHGGEITDLQNGKVYARPLKAGDGFALRAGGGGGYGAPQSRDPERVAYDVRQGYVSRKIARETYLVAITEDGALDLAATQQLRAQPAQT